MTGRHAWRAGCGLAWAIATGWGGPVLAQAAEPAPISDPAFEAALPPLTPPTDPASPEPISREAMAAAPALAAPAGAPEIEAELAAPLTPLDRFAAEAPAELAAGAADAGPAEVPYTVALTGDLEPEVERRFRELSALYADGDRTAAAAQVRLRAEADVELLGRLLHAQAYYDAKVEVAFDPPTGRTDKLDVRLTAAPAEPYRLGDIRIAGAAPVPSRIAYDALSLTRGDRILASAIELAEANVVLRLPQEGYPFAAVGLRDIVLDADTRQGDYTLPLQSGPRAVFGGFRPAGRPVFGARHVARLARFQPGELYDSRQVEDLRQALVATSLLSVAALEPVRTGRTTPDGTEVVDLRVRQAPAPPRTLAATVGYGTGEGFRLSGAWTHRNLFPPEGALSVRAVAGTQEQRAGVTFRRSNAGRRDRTLQATAELSRETREAYDARSFNLAANVSRISTPLWQKRWTYGYGAELVATNETRFEAASAARPRETFLIAALPAQLGFDTSDDLLDPTRGVRLGGRVSPEVSYREQASPYVRTLLDAAVYHPAGSRLVLAGRVRLGAIGGIARDEIAPSRRLYAGGGGSVRGFGYQDLGPRDVNGDPRGGRSLVELSLEARFRRGNFGVVPFVDAGQVYSAATPAFDDLRVGVGVGGRYYTPFGPLRIDVATPLSRRPGDPKVALYISIGQAF